MDSAEFGELVDDIGEHGLVQSIVGSGARIHDGHMRDRARHHAAIEPRFVSTREAA